MRPRKRLRLDLHERRPHRRRVIHRARLYLLSGSVASGRPLDRAISHWPLVGLHARRGLSSAPEVLSRLRSGGAQGVGRRARRLAHRDQLERAGRRDCPDRRGSFHGRRGRDPAMVDDRTKYAPRVRRNRRRGRCAFAIPPTAEDLAGGQGAREPSRRRGHARGVRRVLRTVLKPTEDYGVGSVNAQNASIALTTHNSTPLEMCIETTSRRCAGVFARPMATARAADVPDPKTARTASSLSTNAAV